MTDLERFFRHLVGTLSVTDPARLRQPIAVADIRGAIMPYRHHRRALRIESSEDYELVLIRLCAGEGGFASLSPDEARARFEEEAVSPNPELGIVRQFSDAAVMLAPARIAEAMAEAQSDDEATAPAPPATRTSGAAPAAGAAATEASIASEASVAGEGSVAEALATKMAAAEASALDAPDSETPAAEAPIAAASAEEIPEAEALVDALFATSDTALDAPAAPLGADQIEKPASAISCVACAERLPADRPVKFCPYCGKSQTHRQCAACGADLEPGWRFCALCGHGT